MSCTYIDTSKINQALHQLTDFQVENCLTEDGDVCFQLYVIFQNGDKLAAPYPIGTLPLETPVSSMVAFAAVLNSIVR
jgi:hypothetical protein